MKYNQEPTWHALRSPYMNPFVPILVATLTESIQNGSELQDYNSGPDDTYSFGASVYEGQIFTASRKYTLESVSLLLRRNAGQSGFMGVDIRTVSGGVPTDVSLTNTLIELNLVSTDPDGAFLEIDLDPVILESGTNYAIILTHNAVGSLIWFVNTNTYPNVAVEKTASVWYQIVPPDFTATDFIFETFGESFIPQPLAKEFGGRQGFKYRVLFTMTGDAGSVDVRIGSGTAQTFGATSGVFVFETVHTSGGSVLRMTPSADFNGTVTEISIYQVK